jgi:tRNA threonylcarbamoyladenosine biosynthesis protein TsaE
VKKILINSTVEMANFAKEMAASAQIGDVICLEGTLGAGKTFFAKNFINALQQEKTEILSPTFNLLYSYESTKGEVFHFDLYRLKSANELENIGFFDALENGICLIEWPEIAERYLEKNTTKITIKILESEKREITLQNPIKIS